MQSTPEAQKATALQPDYQMWWRNTKGKVHQKQHSTAGRPSHRTLVLSSYLNTVSLQSVTKDWVPANRGKLKDDVKLLDPRPLSRMLSWPYEAPGTQDEAAHACARQPSRQRLSKNTALSQQDASMLPSQILGVQMQNLPPRRDALWADLCTLPVP